MEKDRRGLKLVEISGEPSRKILPPTFLKQLREGWYSLHPLQKACIVGGIVFGTLALGGAVGMGLPGGTDSFYSGARLMFITGLIGAWGCASASILLSSIGKL